MLDRLLVIGEEMEDMTFPLPPSCRFILGPKSATLMLFVLLLDVLVLICARFAASSESNSTIAQVTFPSSGTCVA